MNIIGISYALTAEQIPVARFQDLHPSRASTPEVTQFLPFITTTSIFIFNNSAQF